MLLVPPRPFAVPEAYRFRTVQCPSDRYPPGGAAVGRLAVATVRANDK
jgi:hypothetical protein